MTREYKRAEHLSLSSAGASIHKAISALLMLNCTCYSYSSVLRSVRSFRHLRGFLSSGQTGVCGAVRRLPCPSPRFGPRQMRRSKNLGFFQHNNLKQFNSGTLSTWTYRVLPETKEKHVTVNKSATVLKS